MAYCCFICKAKFSTKDECKKHMQTHMAKSNPSNANNVNKKTQSNIYPFQNNPNQASKEDVETVMKNEVKTEPVDFVKEELESEIKEEPFECMEKSVAFSRVFNSVYKQYMEQYQPEHTKEKPWQCKQCDERFARKSSLAQHLIECSAKKPFQWSNTQNKVKDEPVDCGEDLAAEIIDIKEESIEHVEEPPASNQVLVNCGLSSSVSAGQLEGISESLAAAPEPVNPSSSVSTGPLKGISERLAAAHEPSFPCSYCDRVYRRRDNLTRHIRRIHSDQPTTCGQCQYLAPSYSELLEHRKCKHASNSSGRQYFYKCPQCDFTGSKANVRRHLTHHTNAVGGNSDRKHHKCPICERAFNSPNLLAKHLASAHGKVAVSHRGYISLLSVNVINFDL